MIKSKSSNGGSSRGSSSPPEDTGIVWPSESASSGASLDVMSMEILCSSIRGLERETMVDHRTVKPGLVLESDLEPRLREMQRALAALGAELPLKFVGLRVCVEANLKMIEELGGATELSDELVSWWRRLDWLREEYLATLRYDRDVVHEDYEAERSQKLNGWRKLFVERAVNGVPRGWLESSRAPKTPIAHFEILAPVRLLGAEMFMLCHRIEARGRGHGPEQVDFARFLNHVSIHRQAFLELEKTGTTSFDLTGAIHDLTDLQNAAQRWSDGKISYDDFCYQGWDANQRLSARTTLVDVPQARELGLSLLEFNTEYSGLCRGLIPLVEKIDRALLIDPSLNRPQNGLGATCPPDIAEAVLRSFGCRVFLLQLGMETVGYYIFAPNPPKTVIPTESLFQDLARHGLIKDPGHTRYGFFHGVAITEAARATLRNAGIRGYRLLDYQMAQTALYEGCQTLVCTVRAGPNRNLAKKQHLDVGWQETGYEVTRRMPGASPLEVLLRDAATGINLPQGAIPQPPQNWGLNPHYRTYTSADVRSEGFTAAATISDYDAEICCRQFAAQTSNGMKVEAYHGSLGFYITISDEMERINFHQQRPGFDLWYCSATDTSAGLSEHLGLIDAQLRARRIGRDKYL